MYLRYSSSVVAPIARSSPRASAGFSRLAASTAPSAAPAPTIVCSSSMKRMTCPSAAAISASTAFSRSSNSPRYLVPATSAPRSSASTRLSCRPSGTSPAVIRWARPSTMAVLPTPGSPISTGLFLVRRDSTWITRRTSWSRPITGSSLPRSAELGQVAPELAQGLICALGIGRAHPLPAAHLHQRLHDAPRSSPARLASASSRCSTATYSSLSVSASVNAASSVSRSARDAGGVALPPSTRGRREIRSRQRRALRRPNRPPSRARGRPRLRPDRAVPPADGRG